jgi:hypothetical protein
MHHKKAANFDTETVSLLRATLDDAWASLRPEQRASGAVKRHLVDTQVFSPKYLPLAPARRGYQSSC